MNAIEFGKFLASLRNEKKLTQEELSEKLFIDKRKVSRWECGMSIPDFETLVKLSEILDVSLYELSICKRLEKEKLRKKAINKFKTIKDFKRYTLKKKILIILAFVLGIFFILTTIYTIKFYGTVEIYEFNSLDEKYILKGTYIHSNDYIAYYINDISIKGDSTSSIKNLNNCEFSINDNLIRIVHFKNYNDPNSNAHQPKSSDLLYYSKMSLKQLVSGDLYLQVYCKNNKQADEEHLINFKFIKKYDNKLF